MMNKVWVVAAKDLRQLSKDRGALMMMFVVPLFLVGILGSVLSGAFNNGSKITATVPVIDRDHGAGSKALIAALSHVPSLTVRMRANESTVKSQVRDGDQVGALIIPPGFSSALTAGQNSARVTYYAVSGNTDVSAQFAQDAVQSVVQQFAFQSVTERAVTQAQRQSSGKVDPTQAQRIAAAAGRAMRQSPPVAVNMVSATGRKVSAEDNAVPGYGLMFALFGIMAGARGLLEERESGTLKRLLTAPLPSYALLGGKLLAVFLQTVVQIGVLFAAGALLFHINLGPSIPALALLIVGTSFAATGLGLILVSIIKSERQVRPATTLIVLGFSALGGSWWPVSIEPQWMQNLAKLTVNGWAMNGFNGLMVFDKSLMQVMPDIAALFIYGLVCFAIARRTFRLREA